MLILRSGTLSLLVLLITSLGPGRPQSQSTEWYGRVVAQSTLEGIAAARVTVEPVGTTAIAAAQRSSRTTDMPAQTLPSTRADTDGNFGINAPPGNRLRISAAGFLDGFVLLHPGRDNDLGRLVLRHEMSFSGRVVRDGAPVEGVVILAPADRTPGMPTAGSAEARSNTDGQFRIGDLRPEQVAELVFIHDGIAQSLELGQARVPLDAHHYELGDIELLPRRTLRGRVVTADGGPVADATVWMSSSSSQRLGAVWKQNDAEHRLPQPEVGTDASGNFVLTVATGVHWLVAFSPTQGRASLSVGVGSSSEPGDAITIVLPGAGILRGRVVGPDGEALPGVAVHLPSAGGRSSGQADPAFRSGVYRTRTTADGCYTLSGLPLGESIWFEVEAPGLVPSLVLVETPPAGSPTPPADCTDLDPLALARAAQIAVTVVDQRGEPIPDVRIYTERYQDTPISRRRGRTPAVSDDNGRLLIEGLPFGDYSLRAQAAGYVSTLLEDVAVGPLGTPAKATPTSGDEAAAGADRAPDTTTVTADIIMTRIENTAPLEVVVFDPRGAPEPEAEVDADRSADYGFTTPLGNRLTGADGRTLFDSVAAGVYAISARARGSRNSSGWQRGYRVEAGGLPAIVNMRALPPLVSLAGRFVNEEGSGIPRAIVRAVSSVRGWREARALTEADGSFRFSAVPAGSYLLSATAEGLPEVIHRALLDAAPPGLDNIVIRMPRLGSIVGTVSGLRAEEAGRLAVQAWTAEEHADNVRLSTEVRGVVADDGGFRIEGLIPGNWTVSARIRDGRQALSEVTVDESASTARVAVVLPTGFTLTGSVVWRGDPPERASLRVSGRFVEFDPMGTFVVRNLRAGKHSIWLNGTGLRSYLFAYADVQSDTHVEIVVRGGAVSGQVVDAETGRPIVGAGVRSDPIPQLAWDAHAEYRRTDRNGSFIAGPFPAGPWHFVFSAPGYGRREPVIDIGSDDIGDYNVELRRTPGLRLRVTTPGGNQPRSISATWHDFATGESYSRQSFPKGDNPGELTWASAPLGRGILWVGSSRPLLAARFEVDNRGQRVEVPLAPAGRLYVTVDEFENDPPSYAILRVFDTVGRPVPSSFGAHVYSYSARSRDFVVSPMVPGTYRIVVTAQGGRTWTRQVEIRPFEDTEVVLRPSMNDRY